MKKKTDFTFIREGKLPDGVIKSRDSAQTGQTGSAQAKPENSDMDSVCHDIAPSDNKLVLELRASAAVLALYCREKDRQLALLTTELSAIKNQKPVAWRVYHHGLDEFALTDDDSLITTSKNL